MLQLLLLTIAIFLGNFGKEILGTSLPCDNLPCLHGNCELGICRCLPCYTGSTCALMENTAPTFNQSSYHVTIIQKPSVGEILVKVTAEDKDNYICGLQNCPCSTIIYSILDDKNNGIFEINRNTGELKLIKNEIHTKYEYSIVVKITNESPFDNTYDTATIFVNFGQSDNDANRRLRRIRRDTSPAILSFSLAQIYPTTNISVISIGQRLTFQLTITFPVGSSNLTVEVFAPEANNPVMMLCNVFVSSMGSSLSTTSYPAPTLTGINGTVYPYTKIKYVITQSHNDPSPTNIANVQSVINFDAYMIYYTDTPNATLYYVSAGAEYLNATQIWVGQSGYYSSVTVPTPSPNITITGDTAVYPGSTAAFDLVIYAPGSYIQLNINFYSPLNDTTVLSFCTVNRYYVGASYSCVPTNYLQPTLSSSVINMQTFYPTANMSVGYITNQLILDNTATGIAKDTIQIKMTLRTNPLAWIGSSTYVGVSVSVTSSSIVSVQKSLAVLTKPAKTPYTNPINAVLDYYNGGSSAMLGSVGKFLLNITLPQGSELDYTITASFQSQTSEVCGFKIFSYGANIPCLNQVQLTPTFTADVNNYQIQATLTIPNVRHVPVSNLSTDDVLQVLILFRPINDSRNTVGNAINSNIILSWNGGTSSALSNSFTLVSSSPSQNITGSNLPTFTFQLVGNNGNVSVSQAATLKFSMVLVPGIVYPMATLEFYMRFNGTARMKICQGTISFVGKNLLCFNKNLLTSNFAYSSKINDSSNNDKLSIPIGSLCTDGPLGRNSTTDDEVDVLVDIFILPHSLNILNAQTTINVGMMLTSTMIWVGTQNINFISAPTIPNLVAPAIPVLYGNRVDNASNLVYQNDIVIMQYIIKIAGGSTATLSFTITSDIPTADNFGVCNITVLQKGNSIPCIQATASTTLWYSTSKFVKSFTLQLGTIINTGTMPLANPSFDDNSIRLEVSSKFGSVLPATFNINAVLNYNSGTVPLNTLLTLQTSLSRFNGTLLANQPVFSFFLMPLFNNSTPNVTVVGYGEALRAVVSVQLQPSTIQSLSVSFSSNPATSNQMDIVSVNILSVGKNIPCLQPGMLTYYTSSRGIGPSIDMNTLNLGTVCRRDIITNSSSTDNTIWIEAVFRVWQLPLNSPTTLGINTIGLVNNDQIYVTKITFNVAPITTQITQTNALNLNVTSNCSLSSTTIGVGQNVTFSISLWLPPYSQFNSGSVSIFPVWPAGADNALIVSDNTNFTAQFGSNVLFNNNENWPMSSVSSMNTSQKDYIIANLGISQNAATSYRLGQNNYTGISPNDSISMQFNIRLTDNIAVINGASLSFTVGVAFGTLQYNQTVTFVASRTNTETISIDANTTLISNNSFYTKNTEVVISTIGKLINGSKLECRNFTIHVAIPAFFSLTSIKNQSYTSPSYPIQQSSFSPGGFAFSVPYFSLTEQLSIIFGITLNQSTTLSRLRQQSPTVIPIIYDCKTLNWPLNPLGNKFINNVTDIRFITQGEPIVIPGCSNDLKVTDNTVITDCSISAYLSPFVGFDQLKVRNNSGAMWKPFIRGGYYNKFRYIDIVFGSLTTVTKVLITSTHFNLPQEISIYGTMDGRSYNFYATTPLLFNGIVAQVSIANPSFNYYGIRIAITKTMINDTETGLNIDLVGCPNINVTAPPIDPCAASYTKPVTTLTDFYRRGFLYIAPNLFVCDDVPSKSAYLETYPRCWRVLDSAPTTWQDMGPYIGKVVGYDISKTTIYGIATDLKSYVISVDDGLTWTSINEGGWKVSKMFNNLQNATEIPWTTNNGFGPSLFGTNCTSYVAGLWNFCYDGVYNNGAIQLSWNNCCSL